MRGKSGDGLLAMESGNHLFGGTGADSFRFNGSSLAAGSGAPIVREFDGVSLGAANGEDKLVFATGLEVVSFAYIGAAAFSAAGNSEALFNANREVEVDRNGDGVSDQVFLLDGLSQADLLTATDFVWL